MGCSCQIDIDHNGGPTISSETTPIAHKQHECCECGRTIEPGEKYDRIDGCWERQWETYKTCADCKSVRAALFCSYVYTTLWEDLYEDFFYNQQLPSANCMNLLTKSARDKVCDLMESCWDDEEDREG